jgi:hypothetical protein
MAKPSSASAPGSGGVLSYLRNRIACGGLVLIGAGVPVALPAQVDPVCLNLSLTCDGAAYTAAMTPPST